MTNVVDVMREICAGNNDATTFCVTLWAFVHTLDDLVDQDAPVTPETVVCNVLAFLETVAFNPFFLENRYVLIGSIRQAAFQWAASEEWVRRERVRDKVIGEILKSGYQDTVFLAASLVGGFQHALTMQEKFRDYEFG